MRPRLEMKRSIAVVALVLGSSLLALARESQHALACSGPGPVENMLSSTVVFEGRVLSVVPNGKPGLDRSPHAITFEVARAYKGTKPGERIVSLGYIPVPGFPIMCPQFPQDLARK